MQFQRAHISIVRSIRHVSLVRDWQRARGTRELPAFAEFVPNERAGDSVDLSVSDILRDDGNLSYFCRQAGSRVAFKRLSRSLHGGGGEADLGCLRPQ
jgi:hypothetical protein